MRESTIRPRIAGACLVFYSLTILALAIWPWSGSTAAVRSVNLVPLRGIGQSLLAGDRDTWINVIGNLVAFAPIGLLLPFWRRATLGATLMAGAGLSAAIELTQWCLGFRVVDIDDLLLNTLGAGLGFSIAWILTSARFRSINQPTPK